MVNKVQSFTDLIVWQKSHKTVILIYKLTKKFPKEELFGLTSQIRRCSVSISSNIAEGFSRKSKKEKTNFYRISLGSSMELQNQILIARDISYITCEEFNFVIDKIKEIQKLLNGLIKSAEARY